ncbi:MAG: hypothetical protein DMG34_07155 [Acidobacteria bacterium]|jgi:hypothetical protein|nr:MAG: hypothetical protein DMG34_07155 [Acidobacteriota bacterium]
MSIQKKSLISTLKMAKKANLASAHDTDAKGAKVSSMRMPTTKATLKATLKSTTKATLKATAKSSFKSTAKSLA